MGNSLAQIGNAASPRVSLKCFDFYARWPSTPHRLFYFIDYKLQRAFFALLLDNPRKRYDSDKENSAISVDARGDSGEEDFFSTLRVLRAFPLINSRSAGNREWSALLCCQLFEASAYQKLRWIEKTERFVSCLGDDALIYHRSDLFARLSREFRGFWGCECNS